MNLSRLLAEIEYRFSRPSLIEQALTHRSAGSPNNERLEFLGDSILNCVIATALFQRFADVHEGDLSRLRANLVRQESLYRIASDLQLGNVLRLGEGELKSGGERRPSILADSLEAVIGAVFLDGGFEAAQRVVLGLYRDQLEQIDLRRSGKDAKTSLQEWLQGRRLPLPIYELMKVRGEAHAQEFEVECRVSKPALVTIGIGPSRRVAEQSAAQRAIEQLSSR